MSFEDIGDQCIGVSGVSGSGEFEYPSRVDDEWVGVSGVTGSRIENVYQ